MKNYLTIAILFIFTSLTTAQDITGKWNGVLKLPGAELRVSFNLSLNGSGYSATMDSPDQGAFGIPMTSAEFTGNTLKLTHTMASIIYLGTLTEAGNITGTFTQAGQVFPLELSRIMPEKKEIVRSQNPVKPYPYYSEDIIVRNVKDSLDLAGTLTLPDRDGIYPVVILISGSGPQNRDEELLGHKPFLVLSDYLTRKGIAVLRFDDRGTNQSTGSYSNANSADFADDIICLIDYLKSRKDIDKTKIGLIGHSEGGIIAPMVATMSIDVRFIVLMAGTGVRGDELLLMQQDAIGKASGASEQDLKLSAEINRITYDIILENEDISVIKKKLTDYLGSAVKKLPENVKPEGMTDEAYIEMIINQTVNPWMLYFIRHDPAKVLEKVKCPVLAVNGSKDLQVPSKVNLGLIKSSLEKAGNKNITIEEIEGLNHLFQECTTGSPMEYQSIDQTLSPKVLDCIDNWIKKTIAPANGHL